MTDNNDNNGKSIKRTMREKKFIEAYIDKGNATLAYLAISPDVTKESAAELGSRMLKKLGFSIVEALDKMGLTDPIISQKLIDGLSATRESGKSFNRKEITDHTTIVKYMDMILKLKASYPIDQAKLELTGPDGQPLARTVVLREIIHHDCPLRSQCPIKEKVEQAENSRKEKDRKNEE
ncbi:hypothetical protein ES702_03110 [subsurface metagenome]